MAEGISLSLWNNNRGYLLQRMCELSKTDSLKHVYVYVYVYVYLRYYRRNNAINHGK